MAHEQTRRVRTTWNYTAISIATLTLASTVAAGSSFSAAFPQAQVLIVALSILQLFAGLTGLYFGRFLRVGRGGGLPARRWVIALLTPATAVWGLSLLSASTAVSGGAAAWTATCLIACLVSSRWRWPVIGVGALGYLAHALVAIAIGGPPAFVDYPEAALLIGYAALQPISYLASLWWWEIVVELDQHRRAAATLAVTGERLRFAADLHDIQGHHLQVISLKAELAERLIDADPATARTHLHDVRSIAKQALEETRSLVSGYRQVSLDDELENARGVLTASGATCVVQVDTLPPDPGIRGLLGSVVREGTTNIIRHSQAHHVTIGVSPDDAGWTLELVNDGATEPTAAEGSGLAGLRERLGAAGGTLQVTRDADQYRLCASLPAELPLPVPTPAKAVS
ncbi:MAG: sensor histidine kinase [Propioniciclava sp.]